MICLGAANALITSIRVAIAKRIAELGVEPSSILYFEEASLTGRDRSLPTVAIFVGGPGMTHDSPLVSTLIADSVQIVPIVSETSQATRELPPQLQHLNALGINSGIVVERVASLVLETFRLLRIERRVFISYRRTDASPFVERLYNALDSRGFDVFLDVRSVPPAVDFQKELWHRMADADVVVLVDTPGFRQSRWTTEELARANATSVQILHLLWPGQQEDSASAFSHFITLTRSDFLFGLPGKGRHARASTLSRVCIEVERLRARALAARHRYLVDNFCDAARDYGLDPVLRTERWISVPLSGGRTLAVVPAVGIPTSDRLNTIFESIADPAISARDLWVVYDNRGVLSKWQKHLGWLDEHLPIRAVQMAHAPSLLKALAR